ncbi:hypothetical protein OIU93_05400 [Paeniglutamicibacter sp. ZC-3]|uniref:hypothetical protein n=1 Tax=Paeniglutamicibacter sp. ZC-3 TaxID=2986919 RepID=UPI0021F6D229|nr:hypothetical protein [Paeniglutamicibacter sp. ZC-3]MCV9993736.1 hypothetical protein [Paeniglutamicibacter sp. ZC-3]
MDKMSDETGPALSRRALREQRRAEAEAKLAQEQASGQPPASPAGKTATAQPSAPASPAATTPAPAPKSPAPSAKAPAPAAKTPAPAAKTPVPKAPAPAVKSPAPAAKPAAKPSSTTPAATPAPQPVPQPEEPVRSRRAAAGEVDAVSQRTERTSLQRARDREALRTRRRLEQEVSELSPKDPSPGDDPAPLTRKQMRLQALGTAKDTGSVAKPGTATGVPESRPQDDAASKPADAKPADAKQTPAKPAASGPAAAKPAAATKPPVKTPAKPAAAKPSVGPPVPSPGTAPQMSVEDALALRRRSGGAAPSEPLLIQPEEDLGEVDLEVLAQQRELAARAAIISRRAAERQRMQEENTQRAGARRSDPFTGAMNHLREEDIEKKLVNTGVSGPLTRGYNIAMTDQGTIVEGRQAPAAPATKTPASAPHAQKPTTPAAKAPAVTPAHKPKAATPAQATARDSTSPAASQAAAAAPARTAAAKPAASAPAGPKAPVAPGAGKAVEAPDTKDAPAENVGPSLARPPVRAVRAQGLEPLDVQTAGMRRANNMYLMVIAALSVGGAALVAGLIMFLNSN